MKTHFKLGDVVCFTFKDEPDPQYDFYGIIVNMDRFHESHSLVGIVWDLDDYSYTEHIVYNYVEVIRKATDEEIKNRLTKMLKQ